MTTELSPHADGTFVGRRTELQQFTAGVAATADGLGSVWFVTGEPGIGKSRLLEEVASIAAHGGLDLHWGRCWEVGGAPAYWPWVQILRSLFRGPDAKDVLSSIGTGVAHLSQLIPEAVGDVRPPSTPLRLEPEQARFQLMDGVATVLRVFSERTPVVLTLEDLHAADPASILLLDFLQGQIRSMRVMVIGTYRVSEAHLRDTETLLFKVAREARVLRLQRLTFEDTAEYLKRVIGRPMPPKTIDVIASAAEGNPLYLGEIVSLLRARGELDRVGNGTVSITVPETIKAAIRERAGALSAGARHVLETASILGREFNSSDLAQLTGLEATAIEDALSEATRAAVVDHAGAGCYQFAHVLIREVFHAALAGDERCRLHLRWADALEHRPVRGGQPPWSEIAHHFAEAGPSARSRAIHAATRAAEQASDQLAFVDAVTQLRIAVALFDLQPEPDARKRCVLLLQLGQAQLTAGSVEAGRESCRAAAELARSLGETELMVQAALTYGSVFLYGQVDRTLVALLEEALAALDERETGLRAHTLARLAAALQPAADPQRPIQLARQAIEMARRVAEPETLLETIRAGVSAMMDLAEPGERLQLNHEHVELARELDQPIEEYRGHMRSVIDAVELGRLTVADAAIESCARIAEATSLPHHSWPVSAFRAMRATMTGRFKEAEEHLAEARRIAERARDPNADRTLLFQRFALVRAQERDHDVAALRPELERAWAGIPHTHVYVAATIGALLARTESPEAQWPVVDDALLDEAITLGDPQNLCHLAEMAAAKGDRDSLVKLGSCLAGRKGHFAHWGLLGMVWEGPVTRVLALMAEALGDTDEAERLFASALEQARSQAAAPMTARIAYEHARSLARRGGAENEKRAVLLLDGARTTAATFDMAGLLARIDALETEVADRQTPDSVGLAADTGVPTVRHIRLERDGETWVGTCDEERFRLKDVKGVRMLARLIDDPGREYHVLDLSGSQGASTGVDAGDAGEVLDDTARAQYQRRIEHLRSEIEEAESWNDPERASRARDELDIISAELSEAFGLGGRQRRSKSASERARVNVQRRLKDAIARIAEQSPTAGRHLEWAVKTGTFCVYDPS